ncbi:hypothetical protein [Ottowia sp.]|uniref:hypothetical protein n=1 Tax=Ottowia sp. TaxID=1898956 RepID=UPI003A883E2A
MPAIKVAWAKAGAGSTVVAHMGDHENGELKNQGRPACPANTKDTGQATARIYLQDQILSMHRRHGITGIGSGLGAVQALNIQAKLAVNALASSPIRY